MLEYIPTVLTEPPGSDAPMMTRSRTKLTGRQPLWRSSRDVLQVPTTGPRPRKTKARRQPVRSATSGNSWIVTIVKVNPIAVWAVSAVPT